MRDCCYGGGGDPGPVAYAPALATVSKTAANQSIPSGSVWTKITFDTVDSDTHSAFASSEFTLPFAGHVQVSAGILRVGVASIIALAVFRNGSQAKRLWDFSQSTAAEISGSVLLAGAAGDVFTICYQSNNADTIIAASTVTWASFLLLP